MLVFPVLKLLLFVCTAVLRVYGTSVDERPPAASDKRVGLLESSAIPNHLPEDLISSTTSTPLQTTTAQATTTTATTNTTTTTTTATTGSSRTTSETNLLVTTTAKTVTPSVTTTSTRPNMSTASTFTATTTPSNSNTTATTNSTTTATTTILTTSSANSTVLTTSKAPRCNCSSEGTVRPEGCDPLTGRCVCAPGYSGIHCQECTGGYFANGTGSCQPCLCDPSGAAGLQCDGSGVCRCKLGVHGNKCADCRPGFFNFSSAGCRPCQCNNHSSDCHTQSGVCLHCQGNTRGPSCGYCKLNFYRVRGSSLNDSCLPCPCSSVTSSGNCTLDPEGKARCDQCKPGYKGPNCEQCQDGYYNSDSICVPCNCSGNEEPSSAPRICHPDTGRCLNCTYSTTGFHCQLCAPGFTGDALAKNCTPIVPTTPVPSSTMTPTVNITDQLPTSSTVLFSSLASPTTNGTSSTFAVSWARFNVIVLAVIITLLLALLGAAGGIYTYRQYQNRKINAPFWTIELKEDNISFSSYHDSLANVDASGLLDDEGCEAASNGQLTLNSPSSIYRA